MYHYLHNVAFYGPVPLLRPSSPLPSQARPGGGGILRGDRAEWEDEDSHRLTRKWDHSRRLWFAEAPHPFLFSSAPAERDGAARLMLPLRAECNEPFFRAASRRCGCGGEPLLRER